MTGEMMFDGCEEFHRDTCRCLEDLNRLMPELSLRYDTDVIMAAMAEHVGTAIWAMRRKKVCDTRQAHTAIQHLEFAAFPHECEPPPGPAPRS